MKRVLLFDPVRVKGHALRGIQGPQFDSKRFVCECGAVGEPAASGRAARDDNRRHKLALVPSGVPT